MLICIRPLSTLRQPPPATNMTKNKWKAGGGKHAKNDKISKSSRNADQSSADAEQNEQKTSNIFVRNLPATVDEKQLRSHFGGLGPLRTVTLIREKETGQSKRCAFVRYALYDHAKLAFKTLNGAHLSGSALHLSYAIPRSRKDEKTQEDNKPVQKPKKQNKHNINSDVVKKGAISKRTVLITPIENEDSGKNMKDTDNTNDGGDENGDENKAENEGSILSEQMIQEAFDEINKNQSEKSKKKKTLIVPEHIIISADGKSARAIFKDWSLAGKAAAKLHATRQFHAKIDASASVDSKTTVIMRNLPFKVKESEIRKLFEDAHINVRVVRMAKKEDSVDCKGYAFVELFTVADTNHAIKQINGKIISNRAIAVDVALGKREHDKKVEKQSAENNDEEEEDDDDDDEDEDEEMIEKEVKLEDSEGKGVVKDEVKEEEEIQEADEEQNGEKKSHSSSEEEMERTVFVRNLLYECAGADVWKAMQTAFGKVEQAVIVKHPVTGLSRGCAFVRFADPASKQKALDSCPEASTEANYDYKGLVIQGRKVVVCQAVNRSKVSEIKEKNQQDNLNQGKKTDPRNLRLALIGKIDMDSEEGRKLSAEDRQKRLKAEQEKKNKLSNNTNSFISDVRLCVRNLPKRGVFEKELRGMFEMAGRSEGESNKKGKWSGGKVVHCTVLKEAETGKSKGYGFVQFERHEDALRALHKLNNSHEAINILVKWMESSKRRQQLVQHSKNKKKRKANSQKKGASAGAGNNSKEGQDNEEEEEDVDEVEEIKALWGKKRRLIVEFSVEDWRNVRVLEKVKQKGAKMRAEQRKEKGGNEGGWVSKSRRKRKKHELSKSFPSVQGDTATEGSNQPQENGRKRRRTGR